MTLTRVLTLFTQKFVNFSSKGMDWSSTSRCNCQSLQLEHLVEVGMKTDFSQWTNSVQCSAYVNLSLFFMTKCTDK